MTTLTIRTATAAEAEPTMATVVLGVLREMEKNATIFREQSGQSMQSGETALPIAADLLTGILRFYGAYFMLYKYRGLPLP